MKEPISWKLVQVVRDERSILADYEVKGQDHTKSKLDFEDLAYYSCSVQLSSFSIVFVWVFCVCFFRVL